jgi:flavin-dependent dehydrogenase
MRYDVVIVGTGTSGAVAATLLAREGNRVGLFGRALYPRSDAGVGWVGSKITDLLECVSVKADEVLHHAVDQVRFFDAELNKDAAPELSETVGYIIDRAALNNGLLAAAAEAGADVHHGCPVSDIALREEGVELSVEGRGPVRGRFLLMAVGRDAQQLARLGVPPARPAHGLWAAWLDAPDADRRFGEANTVSFVLGLTPQGGFGLTVTGAGQAAVAVNVAGSPQEARAWLARFCRGLARKGIGPEGLEAGVERAVLIPPASAALEMDSHVGKHTLIIGEAGGFVSAVSNEGIVPGLWSARIAAEVTQDALRSPCPQDELMKFDSQWRLEMADYLRLPNTDMQFLIPLVFTNQPMADRLATAIFQGENM